VKLRRTVFSIILLSGFVLSVGAQEPKPAFCEGVVEDAITGAKLPNASVKVCGYGVACIETSTDATGEFSVAIHPSPLTYRSVQASKTGYVDPGAYQQWAEQPCVKRNGKPVVLSLLGSAKVTGAVFDAHGRPAAKASIKVRSTRGPSRTATLSADDLGHFTFKFYPRSYIVCATGKPPLNRRKASTPACVSSPDGGVESNAPLRISLGEENVYSVHGMIRDLVEKTPNWGQSVWAASVSPEGVIEGRVNRTSGAFTIDGLTAATYTVLSRSGPVIDSDTGPVPPEYQAVQRVHVGPGSARRALQLTILPNVTVTGRVILLGYEERSTPRVYLESDLPSYLSKLDVSYRADVDGRFRISGMPAGDYRVDVDRSPKGVYIAALKQNGTVVTDGRVRIENDHPTDLEIQLRKSTASVQLNVIRDTGGDAPAGLAVAVPENLWDSPFYWRVQYFDPFRYTISDMAPGTYFIFATNVSEPEIGQWGDELKIHIGSSVRVVVKDGEKETISIRRLNLKPELDPQP
jgi:hypothetical protein